MSQKYDYLIVGAGFAGSTLARLLSDNLNKNILLIDKRHHIGGNAYDKFDDAGVLIHQYGPHIFHTQNKNVWDFLSLYTKWNYYQHWVLSFVDGMLLPIPINITTINKLYGTNYNAFNIGEFFNSIKVDIPNIENSRDIVVSQVGEELYNKFFKNYTKKQWGVDPSQLDKAVAGRIPIRHNFDCRYFSDPYQAIPKDGYTKLFENMLKHPKIEIKLNTSFHQIKNNISYDNLIYCGAIDEFYDCEFGKLPYRSLKFEFESFNVEKYQSAPVINYPNDYDFTRISEYKYFSGQVHPYTTISKEYPSLATSLEAEKYYPIPNRDNFAIFKKYQEKAMQEKNTIFIGRLAQYKYYNMDNVVAQALEIFENIKNNHIEKK